MKLISIIPHDNKRELIPELYIHHKRQGDHKFFEKHYTPQVLPKASKYWLTIKTQHGEATVWCNYEDIPKLEQ